MDSNVILMLMIATALFFLQWKTFEKHVEICHAFNQIIKYSPNPENVANVPRSSDGAISAKYMPSTAVVMPDDKPTINLPTINTSTDDSARQKPKNIAPIANRIAQINSAPLLIDQQEAKIFS